MQKKKVVELSILGQACPACLLVALDGINTHRNELRSGAAELLIRTDHRDATRTIPDSAKAMGYNVDVRKVTSYYEIRVSGRK